MPLWRAPQKRRSVGQSGHCPIGDRTSAYCRYAAPSVERRKMPPQRPILIAGGGPVGVITALALARQGFAVEVFEAEQRVNDNPRAATTHAATLEFLDGLGLVDDVIARGLIEPKFRVWDRATREVIAEFDFGILKDDTRYPFVVQCEQHRLATMTIGR